MAIKTTLEQLEEVQNAISAVMAGQSGSWGDKSVTMADLSALTRRETMLLNRLASEGGKGLVRNTMVVNRD